MNTQEDSWLEVKKHIESELKTKRFRLESKEVDYNLTQFLRGEIAMLKNILELPNKDRSSVQTYEDYL